MKFKADAGVGIGYGHLLGTRWRNKRSGHEYRVDSIDNPQWNLDDMVHLVCETKGGRSTWKYAPHLPFDYEEIKDANQPSTR